MSNLDSLFKKKDITMPTKVCIVKAMFFPVVMYRSESWTIRKAKHRRIDAFKVVLEMTLESLLDCKEIKPVNPKRNQPWIFTGRTDVEAEAPILWPPDFSKKPTRWKDPNGGNNWRQKEKRMRGLDDITDSMDMNLSKLQEMVRDREAPPEPKIVPGI